MFSGGTPAWMFVDIVEHVAAAGFPRLEVAANVLADRLGLGRGEDMLRVDGAAPEYEPVAVACLELGRVHAVGTDLHRVEDLHAIVQQVGMYGRQAPQVWYQIRASVRERMYCTSRFCRGLTS